MDCYSFYEKYQQNDNEWWKLSEGEMQNLYDDAMGMLFGWEKTTNEQIARAEAAEAEVARLRALIETLYVRVNYGEHGEIDNPTPVMCVGVHPIRWGKMAAPTMGFYPFRLPDDE